MSSVIAQRWFLASMATVILAVAAITTWSVWPFLREYTIERAIEPAFWWPPDFHAAYNERCIRMVREAFERGGPVDIVLEDGSVTTMLEE